MAQDLLRTGIKILFDDGDGMRDVGNVTGFGAEPGLEELEHFDAMTGEKDANDVIQSAMLVKFTADSISSDNLRLALLGGKPADEVQAASSAAADVHTAPAVLDRILFMPHRDISSLVITGPSATPTYSVVDDYKLVDAALGHIQIVKGGAIAAGVPLEISYDYAASTVSLIYPATELTINGSGRIIATPRTGKGWYWDFHNCAIKPAGAGSNDVKAWSTLPMELEILKDTIVDPAHPFGTKRRLQ